MTTKSDKLKKKMAMIAREREEYELQKLSMKEDIDYMDKKDKQGTADDASDNPEPSIRRTISKGGGKKDDLIRRQATGDEGGSASSSAKRKSSKIRRNSLQGGASGNSGSGSKLIPTIGRCVSSSELHSGDNSPRPLPIPSGRKISDWCYSSPPDSSTPPVLKGGQDLYVDIRFLGRGAFGTVDLIKNKEDKKLYAVKTMLVTKKEDQLAFLHEVKYLRNRHPFIIHLHDVFITTSPKKVYLVMHYCEGGDLGKTVALALKGNTHIPEGQIFKWFCQISLAVEFLHDLRIVHRDIKLQNILLSDSGEVAQLADFGLATQLSATEDSFESCEVGTPYYTAPEMIQAEPCSFPVDAWSLGNVLFELVALDLPFDGDDTISLVKCILSDHYREDLIPKAVYSPDLLAVVAGLLCKDPLSRMTTAQVLTSPGMTARAAQLPLSYRPKYLEERLKRAHVKQMTRQLEHLGVHCSAAPSSFSSPMPAPSNKSRVSSPMNASSRSLVSPTNSFHRASSPVPSPRHEYPVVQLDKNPRGKTPVMKPNKSANKSTKSPDKSTKSPDKITKFPDKSTKSPDKITQSLDEKEKKKNDSHANSLKGRIDVAPTATTTATVEAAASSVATPLPSPAASSPPHPGSAPPGHLLEPSEPSSPSLRATSSEIDRILDGPTDHFSRSGATHENSNCSDGDDGDGDGDDDDGDDDGDVRDNTGDDIGKEKESHHQSDNTEEGIATATHTFENSETELAGDDIEPDSEQQVASQAAESTPCVVMDVDGASDEAKFTATNENEVVESNIESEKCDATITDTQTVESNKSNAITDTEIVGNNNTSALTDTEIVRNNNTSAIQVDDEIKSKLGDGNKNIDALHNKYDDANIQEDKGVKLPPIAKESSPTHPHEAPNKPQASAVASLPLLPATGGMMMHFATVTSPRARPHGRRHSAHPLDRARRMVLQEETPSQGQSQGQTQGQSQEQGAAGGAGRKDRRRCKSGTTRVVDVVFLKEDSCRSRRDPSKEEPKHHHHEKHLVPFR
jgi:serine/threonine protein kinase